ncbi:MAG: hypothetical protein ABIJ45_10420 [Candidatus Zixiibacteriota bacterium]
MSYTNKELANYHINFNNQLVDEQNNYEIVMSGTDWIDLPGVNLIDGSVIVKALRNSVPCSESIILGSTVLFLSKTNLVLDSVTVASDSSLGTIYTENVDYAIDYVNGTIVRLVGGSIAVNASLMIWYYFYTPYVENSDYQVIYQSGKIKRLVSGDVAENQTVYVDYQLTTSQVGEDAIVEAVAEANALIEKQVDPEGRFGADLTLQTAATYLAVSIVCRMLAIDNMKANSSSHNVAASWLSVAESYRKDFENMLKSFKPDASPMKYPTHS